jgi:hypothetical protein
VIVWLILLLGLVTTALGVAYGGVVAAIISSLGAGIVGAVLSILVARASDRNSVDEISAMLSRSFNARLLSEANELRLVSGDWHHYHLTSVDGRLVWLYTFHRLDDSLATNSMRTRIDVLDSTGEAFPYEVEVGIRGDKGILLLRGLRGGVSSEAVEVIPGFARAFQPVHFGIGMYQTWDGREFVGKIIFSRRKLVPIAKDGSIDEADFPALDRMWNQGFATQHVILPDVPDSAQAEGLA